MATQTIHDIDDGIGFDMRQADLYNDSEDEEENVDIRHRPQLYPHNKNENGLCTCGYIILVVIILLFGSVIGYALGSAFNVKPQQFTPLTNPPKQQNNNKHIINTPSPTQKDPFHNYKKNKNRKKRAGIIDIFASESDDSEPTKKAEKPAFEPSAVSSPKNDDNKPAFEPSAVSPPKNDKPAFEPTSQSNNIKNNDVSNINFDINAVKKILNDLPAFDMDFNDIPLKLDAEYDLGDSSILSKLVLGGYEIPYIFEHAHKFNIKYPFSSAQYANNEYKTWCFHFYLFDYPSAQVDVSFNTFDLERGFDRILIRHFNQSFIDPPIVYAGRGTNTKNKQWLLPEKVSYHLHSNTFKSICIELETDDSVTLSGIDFNIEIKYDDCQWSEYTACNIVDESKKHWDRGPFYDGTCGIGVRQRQRTKKEVDKDAPPLNDIEAFVNCENQDESDIDGPDYCLKAPCETVDNFHNPNGIPANIRYGWANKTSFYNGVGTLDATYPELIRIYTANPSTPKSFKHVGDVKKYLLANSVFQSGYPLYIVNPTHNFDLDSILTELKHKKSEILSEHIDEKVLTMPVLNIKYIDKTMEWLGARLTHSLIIGRVFTMVFTGSSNTAGHDNQFASTFSMQLQARLRSLWMKIGADGAGINIRNAAVGGSPKTETMAWHTHARSSETVAYPFNDINTVGLWHNEDIIFWESFMNDGGRPPHLASEEQLRLTALLNAIWGGMNTIENMGDKCDVNKDLKFDKLRPPKHLGHDSLFSSFTDIYGEFIGLIEMDFATFVQAVCVHSKYNILKINWHPNSVGHRCEADIYAYMLLSAAVKFIEKYKKDMDQLKNDKNNELDGFLLEKSGNWRQKYIESVSTQNNKLFPAPKYCQVFCGNTVSPFALKTSEPDDWDVGFRLKDYIIYNYDKIADDYTIGDDMIVDVKKESVPDIKSRFSTEKLLRSNGWTYYHDGREPPHFPQDRTGKIGSMDRQPRLAINEKVWIERYKDFLTENTEIIDDDLEIFKLLTHKDRNTKIKARQIFGRHTEEWGKYILEKDYDLKVAFLIPEIGNHSLLLFTDEGERSFYDIDKAGKDSIGISLQSMDGTNKINNAKYNKNDKYKYDFNKRLTQQRKCYKYQRGCVFHNIMPGKYIMRYYPINMTRSSIPGLVQIIAF